MRCSEPSLGSRARGLTIFVGLGFILIIGSRASAENPQDVGGVRPLSITVRIYNYARVPRKRLDRAEAEVTAIFEKTGVDVDWLDCPLSRVELAQYPACQREFGPTDFVVRILPGSMASRTPFGEETMGSSRLSPDRKLGFLANISFARVEKMTWGGNVSGYQLLGHAIAHELAHLVFGTIGHSRTGLMAAEWNHRDLQRMAMKSMEFTSDQADQLRAGIIQRARQVEVRERKREATLRTAISAAPK